MTRRRWPVATHVRPFEPSGPPDAVKRIDRHEVAIIAALEEEGSPCDVTPPPEFDLRRVPDRRHGPEERLGRAPQRS